MIGELIYFLSFQVKQMKDGNFKRLVEKIQYGEV
jgi:hypothetical protein